MSNGLDEVRVFGWERKLLWWPTKIEGRWRWFSYIERRWIPSYGHDEGYYEYREVGEDDHGTATL
jgi:hypothetical protein